MNAQPSPGTPAKWTVMLYLAGDNSLSSMCVSILQDLENALTNPDDSVMADADDFVRVLACFDANTPVQKGTRYLELNHRRKTVHNGLDWGLHNDLVPPEERAETNSKIGLERFLKFAVANHLADKYMLILYGHGTAVAGNTFLLDENPHSFVTLPELQSVLAQHFGDKGSTGQKLDILAFNNCVMNGAEIAYQLRGQAKYTIGSQGLVLQVGWPYGKIIKSIVANAKANARTKAVAGDFLQVCARNLLDFTLMDSSAEQSVCNLQAQDGFIAALRDGLAPALNDGLKFNEQGDLLFPAVREALQLAHLEAQSYWDEMFVDCADFCALLAAKCSFFRQLLPASPQERALAKIERKCQSVLEALSEVVVGSFYLGPALQYSHGLSLYLPWNRPTEPTFFDESTDPPTMRSAFDEYLQYPFAQETGWGRFLETYFQATLRDVRGTGRFRVDSDGFSEAKNSVAGSPALNMNLSKSTPEMGRENADCLCPSIKNYPRRFYLSPSDELLRQQGKVSYLGWVADEFIEGLIAPPNKPTP